jgi:predicted dehydrogenase
MNFLIIGLGSMGKRRVRCLKNLGYSDILGFDLNIDKIKDSEELSDINVVKNIDDINFREIDAIIVSTPPDKHDEYLELAIKNKKPVFVEASVILGNLSDLNKFAKDNNVLVAPSCTLKFHPSIENIKKIVSSGKFGKLTNFSYHSGQYLKDWHPWEDVKNYYVSKKETGGCREIVPFELTWLIDLFGFPKEIKGFNGHTMDVGADIDDTYVISLDFGNCYGNLTVDVVSRYATRSLILNMEYGQILWRWEDKVVKLYDTQKDKWIYYDQPKGISMEGYNDNIIEDMYVEEIKCFIDAINEKSIFPNSLDDDIQVLKLVYEVEKTNEK